MRNNQAPTRWRLKFVAAATVLQLGLLSCDRPPSHDLNSDTPAAVRHDEGLVMTCAMQLARNAYQQQELEPIEGGTPLPDFWVAFHGAGRIAARMRQDDRLAFMQIYAEPEYEPRWPSDVLLSDEAKDARDRQIAFSYEFGGEHYLGLMREAIPLCEENPLIVPPAGSEGDPT